LTERISEYNNELVFIFSSDKDDISHSNNINNKYIPLHHMFHLMLVQVDSITSDKTAQTTIAKDTVVSEGYMYSMSKD